jgi:hypothetical protein
MTSKQLANRVAKASKLIAEIRFIEDKNKYDHYEFYFFTSTQKKRHRKLVGDLDKLVADTIAKLSASGFCGPDGLSSADADAFSGVDDVFVFGDGSWC